MVDSWLDEGIKPGNILYFSFDVTKADIDDVLRTYEQEKLRENFDKAEKVFVFFDEIHKAENWQNDLKIFYDLYPNLKFFISGSASINIQKKGKESLAGRMYDFILKPLSFREFVTLKGMEVKFDEWKIYERQALPLLHDYILKGGFPEILEEDSEEKVMNYLMPVHSSISSKMCSYPFPCFFGAFPF